MKLTIRIKHVYTINELLLVLVFGAFTLGIFSMYTSRDWAVSASSGQYFTTIDYSQVTKVAMITAMASALLLALLSFLKKHWEVGTLDKLVLLVGIGSMLYWLVDIVRDSSINRLFYESATPILMLAVFAVFIGMDRDLWGLFISLCKLFGTLFLLAALFEALLFSVQHGFGSRIGTSPVMEYFIGGFWMTAVFCMGQEKLTLGSRRFAYILLFLCMVNALFTMSRGWMLQTVLLFVIYVIRADQELSKRKRANLFKLVGLFSVAALILVMVLPDVLQSLLQRVGEDTRSSQYRDFFSQVSFGQLLRGSGIDASYHIGILRNYRYIDNQVLLLMFRYGVLFAFAFCYFLVKPMLCVALGRRKDLFFNVAPMLLWLAGMLGLSIYFNMNFTLYTFVMFMMCGRCYSQIKETRWEGGIEKRYDEA
ncbi:MAG: hypothetical protein ACLSAP_01425 [Oscillospiraceae bacterium]